LLDGDAQLWRARRGQDDSLEWLAFQALLT
jgi:hypothetical protein